MLVGGSKDSRILLISPSKNNCKVLMTLKGHENTVWCLTTLTVFNTIMIASGSEDKTIKIWNPNKKESDRYVMTLYGHTGGVLSLTTLPIHNNTMIASGSFDYTIKLWMPGNGSKNKNLLLTINNDVCVLCLKSMIFEDEIILISGSYDHTIKFWKPFIKQDIKTPKVLEKSLKDRIESKDLKPFLTLDNEDSVLCMTSFILKERFIIALGSFDKTIKLWRPFSIECETKLDSSEKLEKHEKDMKSATKENKLLMLLKGHNDFVCCLNTIFHNNVLYLVSGSNDKVIKIWNINNINSKNHLVVSLKSHTDQIFCLVGFIGSDGEGMMASVSQDMALKLWK